MKILLIGPYPPPHGGISTHVSETQRRWNEAGVPCRVLDSNNAGLGFAVKLLRCAASGWTLHMHTNGHNRKSWLLAAICGAAGSISGDSALTLHSGMAPQYLAASRRRRRMARRVCSLVSRVVCVNASISEALKSAGVPPQKLTVQPAFVEPQRTEYPLNPLLRAWMIRHSPVFSTTLFFRPEYGFEFLAACLAELRRSYPSLGCVVMGTGEQHVEAEKLIHTSGLQGCIFLAGDVSHQTCLAVISRSDVFLRATLEDGDSISVREALALGVPVVASRVGFRPEGTILFQSANQNDLCAKVALALQQNDHVTA